MEAPCRQASELSEQQRSRSCSNLNGWTKDPVSLYQECLKWALLK